MAKKDETITIQLAGHDLEISSPHKVFFSERGETKLDLIEFYEAVGDPLLAAMGGRPVLLQRFPNGAEGSSFFQKRVDPDATPWLQTAVVSTPNGTTSDALVAADLAHVAWAVNLGCLGFHVWPTRADALEIADELRIDLDPTPGVTFAMVREAAWLVKATFEDLGLTAWPKTTGNRGIHVYVRLEPKWDSYQVRSAAVAMARELERRRPDLVTAAWWKEERGTRVFIDFNQNAPHKTIFGAWCVRARQGRAGVDAVPLGGARRVVPPRPVHHRRSWPRRVAEARRSVGRHVRQSAVARTAARAARARHGQRPDGRAVAAASIRRCRTSRRASRPRGRRSRSPKADPASRRADGAGARRRVPASENSPPAMSAQPAQRNGVAEVATGGRDLRVGGRRRDDRLLADVVGGLARRAVTAGRRGRGDVEDGDAMHVGLHGHAVGHLHAAPDRDRRHRPREGVAGQCQTPPGAADRPSRRAAPSTGRRLPSPPRSGHRSRGPRPGCT